MIYSFTWNGANCRAKDIRLKSMPEIVRPEERVNHIVIPGRSGELTQTEGEGIYNSYIQTIQMAVYTESAVREAEKWLQGDGYVTFSGQPTLKQRARVINAVTFRKHSRNSNWWDGEVQFYCNPLKEAVSESSIEVTSSSTEIANPGDVEALPLITITGSGDMSIACGGNTLYLENVVSGWVVDCDKQMVLENGTALMGVYNGMFPKIAVGGSTIIFSGNISKLTITPRYRYL